MGKFVHSRPAPRQDPPAAITEMGKFCHPCQGQLVCSRVDVQNKIPYFNAPIYLKNKTQIGRVDEILGPLNQLYFTVKPLDSIPATSFIPGDILYIGTDKLLPLERFIPKPPAPKPVKPLNMQGKLQNKKSRGGATGRGGFQPRGRRGGGMMRGRGNFRRGANPRGGPKFRGRGRG